MKQLNRKTDNKHREVEVEEMFESYKKKYIESACKTQLNEHQ